MKRYLVSYSKGILLIRDRKINKALKHLAVNKEIASVYEDAIKDVNYTLRIAKKSKLSIVDDENFLEKSKTVFKPEYGWILPQSIKWAKIEDNKEVVTDTRVTELNKILNL